MFLTEICFCSAKPGKVVGPVVPYENGNIKDAYDPRTLIRSAVLPPQAVPPTYYYRKSSTGSQERSATEAHKQAPQSGMAAKLAPDIAINIDNNPFFMTRAGVTKVEHIDERIAIETNLLQATAQYSGISAASAATATAATHRKVGTVQYGMTKMY